MGIGDKVFGPKGSTRRIFSWRMDEDCAIFLIKQTEEKLKAGIKWCISKEIESCVRAKMIRKAAEERRRENGRHA